MVKKMADQADEEGRADLSELPGISRQTSLMRGGLWAIVLGACGFCVPYLALGAVLLLRIATTDMLPFDRDADLRGLPKQGFDAAVVCLAIFALAAIANFSPRRSVGFIHALAVIASIALLALLAMAAGTVLFGLGPQSYTSDPFAWLRWAIFAIFLGAGATLFIRWQIREFET
jgi:hypothetical protein